MAPTTALWRRSRNTLKDHGVHLLCALSAIGNRPCAEQSPTGELQRDAPRERAKIDLLTRVVDEALQIDRLAARKLDARELIDRFAVQSSFFVKRSELCLGVLALRFRVPE